MDNCKLPQGYRQIPADYTGEIFLESQMLQLARKALAYDEWMEKTDWVQKNISTFPISTMGKHRADVLREEIERLRAATSTTSITSTMSEPSDDEIVKVLRSLGSVNRIVSLELQNTKLRTALEDMIDPIATMKKELPEGHNLDGHAAIRMADDPQWYRRRAEKAILADDASKPTLSGFAIEDSCDEDD